MKKIYKKPQLEMVNAEMENECMGPAWVTSNIPAPVSPAIY